MERRLSVAMALVLSATAVGISGADATPHSMRDCRAADVRRDTGFVFQPAGPVAEGAIRLTAARRTACILPRPLHVRLVALRHGQRIRQRYLPLQPGEVVVRRLPPHRTVILRVVYGNWCGRGSNANGRSGNLPRALVLYDADGRTLMRLPVNGAPACYLPSRATIVQVTPFFRIARVVGG